jgi:hypothetical protein
LGESLLDCVGLLQCASTTLKKENKIKSIMFLVAWQDMTKEVGEIIFEMEENMNNPVITFQGFVDQISIK